jgi:hypothetical protein
MSRKANTKSRSFPIVLKSIIDDAHRDNKSFTLNDKQIRSRLRVAFRDMHVKNTSWVANNAREYDAIRRAFDVAYANKMTRKPRTSKRVAKTNDVANVETNDA